jgi:hypothetical protein
LNKLRLFYVYKFDTSRLKEYNNDIKITINEARRNGELVSVGDSQVLRIIRKIKNSEFSEEILKKLEERKSIIKKLINSDKNVEQLQEIQSKIDNLLHIPEYISIVVKNKSDYRNIISNKFKVNGIKYVRLMCGAGHARKNTVIFCASNIENKLKEILQNGRKSFEMSHSKYNAYFALYSSATHVVSSPRVCVIPDCNIMRTHKVDWVTEDKDGDTVEEKEKKLEFNLWDGMGIISPTQSEKWAKELGVDYIPSAFTIRNSFIKGMVCTFDFHKFAEEVANKCEAINDVWRNPISDIRDYDMMITESQFKLWKAYESWEQYKNNCERNDISWGISRVSPKEEKNHIFTNYQFVQAISLDDENIESLCQPTIDWIKDVLGADVMKTLLFLSGNSIESAEDVLNLKTVKNYIIKALLLNKDVIKDPYVKSKIYNLIQRKVKDSYIGKLLVSGNFQVMISDPYALCEYMFGMEVKGLLNEWEYYSKYWSDKNINTVVAMRSPLTWRSEVNKLKLKHNDDLAYWYQYLNSGIIYPVHGVDTMLAADSDFDADAVMTTDCKEFIDGVYGGLPITYKKNLTLKTKLQENILYLSDLYSFNSEIGVVTNRSTTMYAMLADYEEDSPEYKELIKRLKICRKEQGSQIDKAKGIIVKEFPEHWVKEQDILDSDTQEIKDRKIFENKLVIKKKPYFMRWLYKKYNSKFTKYQNNANTYCLIMFGCHTVEELIQKHEKTEVEQSFIDQYFKWSPLNMSNCSMNNLCKYMESVSFDFKRFINDYSGFDYSVLIDKNISIDENGDTYQSVLSVFKSFNQNKNIHSSIENSNTTESKDKNDEEKFNNIREMYKYYNNKLIDVCSNSAELANIAVDICYRLHPKSNKDFVWEVCQDGVLCNLEKNRQEHIFIPVKDQNGDILYLGDRFIEKEVTLIEDI